MRERGGRGREGERERQRQRDREVYVCIAVVCSTEDLTQGLAGSMKQALYILLIAPDLNLFGL